MSIVYDFAFKYNQIIKIYVKFDDVKTGKGFAQGKMAHR